MLAVGASWPSAACPCPWSWPCPCPCRRQRPFTCAWCVGRRSGSRLATASSCPPNSPSTVLRGSPLSTCGSMVCGWRRSTSHPSRVHAAEGLAREGTEDYCNHSG
eukprot:13756901-Alexandrium_andersonii.AAC.1